MFKIHLGLQVLRPTQTIFFRLFLISLFVASIYPQTTVKKSQTDEAMIATIKNHYLSLMRKHSDWLKRILGVVKLELTYRQLTWNCRSESCLYSIDFSESFPRNRHRRSASKKDYYNKYKKITRKKMNTPNNVKLIKPVKMITKKISKVTSYPSLSTKSNEIHMSECQGKYVHYCRNGAKCVYIDLLQEAVCMCRKGFTGKRCVDFSLSDTVQSLRTYESNTLNVDNLNPKESEDILSIVDAAARFTLDANRKEPDEVKKLLDAFQNTT